MFEGLRHLFSRRSPVEVFRDFFDIFLVAFMVYRALLVLRGTRAQQMGIGLVVISGLYLVAKFTGLVTVLNLLSTVLSSIVLIVVVVFQADIRRALIRVGDQTWLPGSSRAAKTRAIEEVVAAASELARHRVGALIAFEQDANLDEFVMSPGIPMESAVSRELLVALFLPEAMNKLHDGAIILRNYRIASAGVFFPMPEARNVDSQLGSRHRAALGITEETDAIVLVVSEERGTITVCYRGNMIQNLDGVRLRAVLMDLFGQKETKKPSTDGPPKSVRAGAENPRASMMPEPNKKSAAGSSGGSNAGAGSSPLPLPGGATVREPRHSEPPGPVKGSATTTPLPVRGES
jgi:diadenylate cyclase